MSSSEVKATVVARDVKAFISIARVTTPRDKVSIDFKGREDNSCDDRDGELHCALLSWK
jgi:hypothetical protein